jgi:hypothetical protein
MAWVALNKNYAANAEQLRIVRREHVYNGMGPNGYHVVDDEFPRASNRGVTYASFDERVASRDGGTKPVYVPAGVSFGEAIEIIRYYGEL